MSSPDHGALSAFDRFVGAPSSSTSGRTRASTVAPEFGFEHDLDNVRRALSALDVGYPVVIDNDFAIWPSLDNHYWPAVYLVDGDGRVRFQHFGEEAYEETERAIQRLLGVAEELLDVDAGGLAQAADWDALRSPETYLGLARREPGGEWELAGEWSLEQEAAVLDGPTGSISCRFEARDVNLVLAPPDSGGPVGILRAPGRRLIRRRGPVHPGTFEIAFDGPGVRAYVFTFG